MLSFCFGLEIDDTKRKIMSRSNRRNIDKRNNAYKPLWRRKQLLPFPTMHGRGNNGKQLNSRLTLRRAPRDGRSWKSPSLGTSERSILMHHPSLNNVYPRIGCNPMDPYLSKDSGCLGSSQQSLCRCWHSSSLSDRA